MVWVLNGGLPSVIMLASWLYCCNFIVCLYHVTMVYHVTSFPKCHTPPLVPSHIQITIWTTSLTWVIHASFCDFLFYSTVVQASLLSVDTASQDLCLGTSLNSPHAHSFPPCYSGPIPRLFSSESLEYHYADYGFFSSPLSVSVECWPLESWGLASFRLNSQFLCQVIVSSIWRLECEFKSDNSGKSPDLGLTGRVFTVKSQGLECFIPWLLLQFSFFLLVKMDFINAWYDTVVNCLLYICSEFPHLCFFIVYNLDF